MVRSEFCMENEQSPRTCSVNRFAGQNKPPKTDLSFHEGGEGRREIRALRRLISALLRTAASAPPVSC